jgi:hypothetical protein
MSVLFPPIDGSKCNIPCCALLARQVNATFASDSRMTRIRRESGAFAYDVRHVARVSCKCCAHLPRVEGVTSDVTFGPLCRLKNPYCSIFRLMHGYWHLNIHVYDLDYMTLFGIECRLSMLNIQPAKIFPVNKP